MLQNEPNNINSELSKWSKSLAITIKNNDIEGTSNLISNAEKFLTKESDFKFKEVISFILRFKGLTKDQELTDILSQKIEQFRARENVVRAKFSKDFFVAVQKNDFDEVRSIYNSKKGIIKDEFINNALKHSVINKKVEISNFIIDNISEKIDLSTIAPLVMHPKYKDKQPDTIDKLQSLYDNKKKKINDFRDNIVADANKIDARKVNPNAPEKEIRDTKDKLSKNLNAMQDVFLKNGAAIENFDKLKNTCLDLGYKKAVFILDLLNDKLDNTKIPDDLISKRSKTSNRTDRFEMLVNTVTKIKKQAVKEIEVSNKYSKIIDTMKKGILSPDSIENIEKIKNSGESLQERRSMVSKLFGSRLTNVQISNRISSNIHQIESLVNKDPSLKSAVIIAHDNNDNKNILKQGLGKNNLLSKKPSEQVIKLVSKTLQDLNYAKQAKTSEKIETKAKSKSKDNKMSPSL